MFDQNGMKITIKPRGFAKSREVKDEGRVMETNLMLGQLPCHAKPLLCCAGPIWD
jgi:hypothetical protein